MCVHLAAAASPGPDFVYVTQQSLISGRKAGLFAALGITLGLSVHISYSLLGLSTMIAESEVTLCAIKLVGGAYLLYLGIKAMGGKKYSAVIPNKEDLSVSENLRKAFLCNLLNPKAPLYFIGVFSVVVSSNSSDIEMLIYAVSLMLVQLSWFSFVALAFSKETIRTRYYRHSQLLNNILAVIFIILSLRVLKSIDFQLIMHHMINI